MLQFISQPSNGQLGTILINKLSEDKYKHFIIVSAFAKNSGVLRLKDSLIRFKEKGGTIEAFIGLDAYGTSYEALLNLLPIVNELYVIHDNSPSVTFHPKIYYLSDLQNDEWIASGSNNLTGGGLWTNIENTTIIDSTKMSSDIIDYITSYKKFISYIKDTKCEFSLKIEGKDTLDKLLNADLLRHEIQLQIDPAFSTYNVPKDKPANTDNFFGISGKVHIPEIPQEGQNKKVRIKDKKTVITSVEAITPSDSAEKMWFETREMTGGSRNILDLSMLGTLSKGTGNGTRYETDNYNYVLGSVVFFDIDPTNTAFEKDVTINYAGKDYVGCTIKMHLTGANPNGSWRIQLKGESASNEKLTTAEGVEWLRHKIIVLEKIRSEYYVMSVVPETEIDKMKSRSIFVAHNGSNTSSKQYGLLNI